jgi:HlyD family secretion protein
MKKLLLILFFAIAGTAVAWKFQPALLGPILGLVSGGDRNGHASSAKNFEFTKAEFRELRQTVSATGTVTLKTGAEVKIGSRISGQLEQLFVQIGDSVKAGEVIAVIEHFDLDARVSQRKAELSAQRARLEKIANEGPLEINKARAEYEEIEVQIELAEKMLKRNQELSDKGVVSVTVLDESQEKLKVIKARYKSAEETLRLKESQLQNDIRLGVANVEKAKADLQEVNTQLSYATIVAPTDGTVASISTQKGETVAASLNSPTFVTLVDLNKLEVTVYVDETDIGRVKVDQEATFTVDSYAKKFFKGIVREIRPKAMIKDHVVNYETILEIEKSSVDLLRPEMTANVSIVTDKKDSALAIPKKAIKRKGDKQMVTVNRGGTLSEAQVSSGWRDGKFIEIVSGLKQGDMVGIPLKPQGADKKKRRRRS